MSEQLHLPAVALRGRVLLPYVAATFDVGRLLSLGAIKEAFRCGSKEFVAIAQRDEEAEEIDEGNLYGYGTVFAIAKMSKISADKIRVTGKGAYRVRILSVERGEETLFADVEKVEAVEECTDLETAYYDTVKVAAETYLVTGGRCPSEEIADIVKNTTNRQEFVYNALEMIRVSTEKKQAVLSAENVTFQYELLTEYLTEAMTISKLERQINAKVKADIEKGQKEYYLREQLKIIHRELGDDESERDELERRIKEKGMPKEIEEKALKDLSRMARLPATSPDYNVTRTYLDWLLDLEWKAETKDTEKLEDAAAILNADHYGLEKIKERITEYLAVLKLTGGMNAPIICLVGPPGVGKTSIATSIARSLGRKFVRMSLGGVTDEAEIRGHRKTYVGAMPGRIICALKNAGSINSVFLLDEIDKLSSDRFRGDPSSALLEVLDPAQNSTFRDRYLEVPYDLSKVLFITTANDLYSIPEALRDRMEIIELSGYTQYEKREIAKRFLIPRKCAANGLDADKITLTDAAIDAVTEGYTREAGVRQLEREIDAIMRKIAVRKAGGKAYTKRVGKNAVEEYLGAVKYTRGDELLKGDTIGAATGLAWTSVGGTALTIEVLAMHGKGEILLTGKLGDVMKESARAAISYIRSNAQTYGLEEDMFANTDIHVHVPEGATPKDGPSAGITMATAILSAFTQKPVRRDVAMTGEITLLGNVLPIGGLKEKSVAAYRIGVHDVIIPRDNVKDLDEVSPLVRENIKFIPVDNVGDVFKNAIVGI